jgi:hypothetical protein
VQAPTKYELVINLKTLVRLGVSDRVLDVLMPEVVLHRRRVVAVIGELENHGYYRAAFDLMPDGKPARWIVA